MDSGSLQSSSGGDDEYTSLFPNYSLSSPKPDFSSLMNLDPFSAQHTIASASSTLSASSASASAASTAPRNPRKRSRASRRAPTTVLTTDTTNFRAMVQEFTGIPAPPFSSSPFVRPRLDPSEDVVLLRPFAQKFQVFQNQSQGLINLRNQSQGSNPLTFQSLLNQPGGGVNHQGGDMPPNLLVSSEGPTSQNVMEQWLCSSVNR